MAVMIFALTSVISTLGWLNCQVGVAALVKYMADKSYTPPSDVEIKACCYYVWKKLLHIR